LERDEIKKLVQLAKKEHSRIEADPAENYWFRVVGMETKMRIVKVRKQQKATYLQPTPAYCLPSHERNWITSTRQKGSRVMPQPGL